MPSNVITNREYLGDITTAAVAGTFSNQTFIVNPGQFATFPWLATIAQNFEQYRFHGIVFEFRSTSGDSLTSTNTALGTVIMATDYNPNALPYSTKQIMENSQYAQSTKGSLSQVHGLVCDNDHKLFTRTGSVLPVNDSLKWYDHANFQIATTGFQGTSVNVGELWVTYVVELFKPQIPAQLGGSTQSLHVYRTGGLVGNNMGTATGFSSGNIAFSFPTSQTIALTGLGIGTNYVFTANWSNGTPAVVVSTALSTFVGSTPLNILLNDSISFKTAPDGVSSTISSFIYTFKANASTVTLVFTGTCPQASIIDIFVNILDASVTV